MEIIRPGINLDFIGRMKVFALVSVVLVALVLLLMVGRVLTGHDAFNYGIDFSGGTLLQLRFQQEMTVDHVRAILHKLNLSETEIQRLEAIAISSSGFRIQPKIWNTCGRE